LKDPNNPYYEEIETFTTNSSKLAFCLDKAEKLGTMRWKGDREKKAAKVYEKLVIVGHNPVICAIVARVCVYSNALFLPVLLTLLHSRRSNYS
jgi:phosphohistidine phosphatase SixA